MRIIPGGLAVTATLAVGLAAQQPKSGLSLGTLTWRDAETALTASTVVVLPLGAASLEHGPHMKLDSSDRLARYLAERVRTAADVVIAPPLTYHFYPAFAEYPGSTSLSQNTARDMTVEIVRSLSKFGPRRFYVLNTGITTMTPLKLAADALADQGILLGYTDIRGRLLNAQVTRQQTPPHGAGHADEIETSMMLFVDPGSVDMSKAVREYGSGSGALTRLPDTPGMFSAWGVVGDATVATKVKGQAFVEAVVAGALEDIEGIRKSPLPVEKTTPTLVARAAPPRPATSPEPQQPNGCMPPDERAIRAIGDRFNLLWRNMDSDGIGKLFGDTGDM